MMNLGWHNLKRDPVRAAIATLGVVFAVVLVMVETGLLLGMVRSASLLIDASPADVWVSTVNVETFDFATPFNVRKKFRIRALEGVESVEEYFVSYSSLKLSSGGNVNVQVVGFDVRGKLAAPLNLVAGRVEDLTQQDTVIIDEADRVKLGNPALGDTVEVLNKRARLVGFTRGMRSFTTTPYVFTSLENCGQYSVFEKNSAAVYLLIKTAAGVAPQDVCNQIIANVPDVEAHTRAQFAWRTQRYWLLETGVGLGFLGAAFLGLLVGGVIVSQTLYAMTVEKLPEFGVLKALGATMGEISGVVLQQGMICGAVGLLIGLLISVGICLAASRAGTVVQITFVQIAAVIVITAGLCAGASVFSVLRLRRIDPAMVFRT